jgi:hypothetical protein
MKRTIFKLSSAILAIALLGCAYDNPMNTQQPDPIHFHQATKITTQPKQSIPIDILVQITNPNGSPAPNLTLTFSPSIAGRSINQIGSAITDQNGQATLTVQTTGYYHARATNASNQIVGHWNSIPINADAENILTLPIGGPMIIHPNGPQITVMTRNLYLGGDINRVLAPSNAQTPIPVSVAQTWAMVQQTNFAERARAIATEIATTRPHLIGLQEVTLFRIQNPGDFLTGNTTPATTVALDQLAILLDALNAKGLTYLPVAIAEGIDVELPMVTGQTTPLADIRLTDREVILARADVQITNVIVKKFNATLPVSLGEVSISIPRAWASVDATLQGRTLRFVTTHLETGVAEPIQRLQASELLQTLASTTIPTLLVGDFNSDARGTTTQTYQNLINAGLIDVWNAVNPNDPGLTGSQQEDLRNSPSALNRRIDLIFTRATDNLTPLSAQVVGDKETDRTPSAMWPSDHAGVVATLRLPAVKPF